MTNGPNSRRSLTRLAREDSGVAAVVGFVLILAAAITYYSYVARSDVPKWGAEAERAWDAEVGDALLQLERDAGARLGSDASVSGGVPASPEPRTLSVPFIIAPKAQRPSGSLSFDPGCGGVTATHDVEGASVTDLAGAGEGCLSFRAQTTYTSSYAYRIENGGLLRVQGDQAAVLAGPPLEIEATGSRYVVSLTVLELRGEAAGTGADQSAVPVSLVPRPGSTEALASTNAAASAWTIRTPWPEAWAQWYGAQLSAAGVDPAYNYACRAGDARDGCAGVAADEVRIVLHGPNGPLSPLLNDVSLSLSYGRYDVTMG